VLKVLITGAFSTGKSTLVDRLASFLQRRCSVAVAPDIARDCPFMLNRAQDENGTLWLLTRQISNELEISRDGPEVLLCDRGIPDILAHLEEARSRGAAGTRPDLLRPFLIEWCKTYKLVLVSKIDVDIPPAADRLRLADAAFRSEMEALAHTVLEKFTPHAITLRRGMDDRFSQALEIIKQNLTRLAL